jgi:pimeloyl-ACP methyl ester carboxylesterase
VAGEEGVRSLVVPGEEAGLRIARKAFAEEGELGPGALDDGRRAFGIAGGQLGQTRAEPAGVQPVDGKGAMAAFGTAGAAGEPGAAGLPGGAAGRLGHGLADHLQEAAVRAGEDFYHAGLSADLQAALASAELRSCRRIYVLGYSLGGHVALRFGTEAGDGRLAAVAAICSPLDLALSQKEIDAPGLWVYRRYLLANLLRLYAAVAARRPVPVPVEVAARARTIRAWDDLVVAPRHGFADAGDYYARASVAPRLPDLRVPALLVNSDCDPMVPARGVRPALERAAPLLTVRWIPGGGHCAFPRRLDAGLGPGAGLEAQVLEWLRGRGMGP